MSRTPASNAWPTSTPGATIPSDRVEWVWRSIVDGLGGSTRPAPLAGSGSWRRRRRGPAVMSRLDESLDTLDGQSPAGGGIDVDLDGVEDDGPLAHLEPCRQRVDESRDDGPRVEPDDAPDGARHADVGLVRGPVRQDPLVDRDDVGMGADDDTDAPVEAQPERVLLGCELAMEIDETDRRQRLGRFVEQRVGVGERVLDLGHVGAALEIDDGDVRPVERLVGPPAAARDLVGAVVQRPQDAVGRLEIRVDLALVPDVVPARDDIDAGREDRVRGRGREAHAAGDVLAVRGHEVDAALIAQAGQEVLDRDPARLADEVPDHEDPTDARRSRQVAVGRIAETGASGRWSRVLLHPSSVRHPARWRPT